MVPCFCNILNAQLGRECTKASYYPKWGIDLCLQIDWYSDLLGKNGMFIGHYAPEGLIEVRIARIKNYDTLDVRSAFQKTFSFLSPAAVLRDSMITAVDKQAYIALYREDSSGDTFRMAGVMGVGPYFFIITSDPKRDLAGCWKFLQQMINVVSFNKENVFVDDRSMTQEFEKRLLDVVSCVSDDTTLFFTEAMYLKIFSGRKHIDYTAIMQEIDGYRWDLLKGRDCEHPTVRHWTMEEDLAKRGDNKGVYYDGSFDILCNAEKFHYTFAAVIHKGSIYFQHLELDIPKEDGSK